MSRSGYSDDLEPWQLLKWRGQVASAIRGKRGQRFLRDLRAALEAMPNKRLVASELETSDGEVCALGALGRARGMDMAELDPEDRDAVALAFDIAPQLAAEVVFENDEAWADLGPEVRWQQMHAWACEHIREQNDAPPK